MCFGFTPFASMALASGFAFALAPPAQSYSYRAGTVTLVAQFNGQGASVAGGPFGSVSFGTFPFANGLVGQFNGQGTSIAGGPFGSISFGAFPFANGLSSFKLAPVSGVYTLTGIPPAEYRDQYILTVVFGSYTLTGLPADMASSISGQGSGTLRGRQQAPSLVQSRMLDPSLSVRRVFPAQLRD